MRVVGWLIGWGMIQKEKGEKEKERKRREEKRSERGMTGRGVRSSGESVEVGKGDAG